MVDYEANPLLDKGIQLINTGSFPAPIYRSVSSSVLNTNTTYTLIIKGDYFTKSTNVTLNGSTVTAVIYKNSGKLELVINTGGIDGVYDLVISTTEGGSVTVSNAISLVTSNWIDLRLGGDILTDGNAITNDIRYKSTMTMLRDAGGISFSGQSSWRSWVKFNNLKWNRGVNRTLEFVFTRPNSSMMLGVGSEISDENSTSQYSQNDMLTYFNNSTSNYGVVGNNGTLGTLAIATNIISIAGGTGVYKVVITNDGTLGLGTFTLYELPSANLSDWNNISNPLISYTVPAPLVTNQTLLLPVIIPSISGTQRFVAIKLN